MINTASLSKLIRIRAERERIALIRSAQKRAQHEQANADLETAHQLVQLVDSSSQTTMTDVFADLSTHRDPIRRIDTMLRTLRNIETTKQHARQQLESAHVLQAASQARLADAIFTHGSQKRSLDALNELLTNQIISNQTAQDLEEAEIVTELATTSKVMQSNV